MEEVNLILFIIMTLYDRFLYSEFNVAENYWKKAYGKEPIYNMISFVIYFVLLFIYTPVFSS